MALLLSGSDTDKINHGSDASLDNINTGTFLVWAYSLFDASNNAQFFHKATFPNARNWMLNSSSNFILEIWRNGGTSLQVSAALANFAHYGTSKWCLYAVTYDTAAGDPADIRLLIGDLDNLAAEPSSYATQRVGSGGVLSDDSGADFIVGNHPSGTVSWDGRLAVFAAYRRTMTVAEIQALQFRLIPDSTLELLVHYGHNKVASQIDWSGNDNHGTITGATLADHVPLGPQFGFDVPYSVPAPAAVVGVVASPYYYQHLMGGAI